MKIIALILAMCLIRALRWPCVPLLRWSHVTYRRGWIRVSAALARLFVAWHWLAKRLLWRRMAPRGAAHGMLWANCKCGSTLAREARR